MPTSPSTMASVSSSSRHPGRCAPSSSVPRSQRRHQAPHSGLYLIVSDIDAGRADLVDRGAKVSDVFHAGAPGAQLRPGAAADRVNGPDPDHKSYSSFATFEDPDGNGWLLQEVTDRLPGRVDPDLTSFSSAGDLASALRRAAAAHGEHEKLIGKADPDWPDWYARYMVAEQAGEELPT